LIMILGGQRLIRGLLLLVLLLALPALACKMPDIPDQPSIPGLVEPTPVGSPTPIGDTISYLIPAYSQNLKPGETVPGTQLTYVGSSESGHEVTIGGQPAIKKAGDSFYWSGVIAPGVFANYNLRLTTSFFGGMPVAGPVELIILFPEPQPLILDGDPQAKYHMGNIVIDYHVPLNEKIPGTTLVYQGLESQGLGNQSTTLARIGGLNGYPNLAVGDSLVWSGILRENVAVRYNLRVVSFDEENLRVVGTGELWITG
jgi:hypothetical protein